MPPEEKKGTQLMVHLACKEIAFLLLFVIHRMHKRSS